MPGGMGDYEVTDATDNPTKPCPIYYVQARKYGNTSILYNSAEEIKTVLNQTVHFVCNRFQLLGVGMYCVNSENTANGGCLDYQVRFCCGNHKLFSLLILIPKTSPLYIAHYMCNFKTSFLRGPAFKVHLDMRKHAIKFHIAHNTFGIC